MNCTNNIRNYTCTKNMFVSHFLHNFILIKTNLINKRIIFKKKSVN